jgi:hypothetical protein
VLGAAALTGCMEVGGSTPAAPGATLPQNRPSLGHTQEGLVQGPAGVQLRGVASSASAPAGPHAKASGVSGDLAAGTPSAGATVGRPGGAASPGGGAAAGSGSAPGGSGGGANGGGTGGSSGGGTGVGGSPSATASVPPTLPPPTSPPPSTPPPPSPSATASAGPTP